MSYDEAVSLKKFMNPALELYYENPLMLSHGDKQFVFDVQGNKYLDLLAGKFQMRLKFEHISLVESA